MQGVPTRLLLLTEPSPVWCQLFFIRIGKRISYYNGGIFMPNFFWFFVVSFGRLCGCWLC